MRSATTPRTRSLNTIDMCHAAQHLNDEATMSDETGGPRGQTRCEKSSRPTDDQVNAALADFGVPREVVADKARAPVPVALCGKDDLRMLKMRTMEIYKW